jgi:hypothetical protein
VLRHFANLAFHQPIKIPNIDSSNKVGSVSLIREH